MQIVAPAGSYSALRAAVIAGADAVYLGMPDFGARAKAENFTTETLKAAVDYAHMFGTRVFITLNTLIKDGEMRRALDTARFAYDSGVDAAIVQDIRFIEKLKNLLPDFPLHASTQMGVHNAEGARVLSALGIRRAVLARETLPDDIRKIKETGLEIEFFVQGALCVCFSGNCYFSSLASSYSGNRGKCMQLCRKPYVFNGKRGYFLSAKDICLYDRLEYLKELGVDAIKIEGRMRSEEYVAQAVSVYKSAMPAETAVKALKSVYNRGDYCSAYLDKNAEFRVIYAKSQANIGISVGKIDKVAGKRLTVNGFTPHVRDGFKVMRNGEELAGASVQGGAIIASAECRSGDELRRTFDGALSDTLKSKTRTLDVHVNVELRLGKKPRVTLCCNGSTVTADGDTETTAAITRALTEKDIERVFLKTAEHPFRPRIDVSIDDGIFMPIGALNELRRSAYDKLKSAIIQNYDLNRFTMPYKGLDFNRFIGSGTMLMVESAEQLNNDILSRIDYLVLNPRDYGNFTVPETDIPVLLNLPIAARGEDMQIIRAAIARKGICGVISNNLYSLGGITDKPILLGTGHNIIGNTDLLHVRSFEADETSDDSWTYVFGYAPVMTLCHCPYDSCIKCAGDETLTDERGRVFTYRRYKLAHCYRQLLNCVPHNLIVNSSVDHKNKFYDCTTMSAHEIVDILDGRFPKGEFTRGNMNKGLK